MLPSLISDCCNIGCQISLLPGCAHRLSNITIAGTRLFPWVVKYYLCYYHVLSMGCNADNIDVNPISGDLWVGVHPSPVVLKPHHKDPTLPTAPQIGLQLCLLIHTPSL